MIVKMKLLYLSLPQCLGAAFACFRKLAGLGVSIVLLEGGLLSNGILGEPVATTLPGPLEVGNSTVVPTGSFDTMLS